MKLFNYQTNILGALKSRIFPDGNPKGAFWWPVDEWTDDPEEIIRAIRLDDDMGVKS